MQQEESDKKWQSHHTHHRAIRFHEFGKMQDVLVEELVETPILQAGQVQVEMLAAPVNPADGNFVQGNYGVVPELPAIPGMEGTGRVIASMSDDIQVGDQVVFLERVGAWQEIITCPRSAVMKLEEDVDPIQASMLKVNPFTAWQLIHKFRTLSAGDWIIQNAANSGVGQCVIQIAKQLGVRTINVVRSEAAAASIRDLGGDVCLIDGADLKSEMHNVLKDLSLPAMLPKAAFNAVGGDSALRLMDCVEEQGVHITYGAMSMRSLKVPNKFLIFKRIELHGLWITKDIADQPRDEVERVYHQLAAWVREGKLTQLVAAQYTFGEDKETFLTKNISKDLTVKGKQILAT